jgi:hypothetical protein
MNPRSLLFAVSGLSMFGCGGGSIGAGQGSTFTTSVSSSIPIDGLTGEQATQLCDDVNSATTATLGPTYCASVNLGSAVLMTNAYLQDNPTTGNAELQTACSQFAAGPGAAGCRLAASCDALEIASNSSSCVATVADLVNCINENDALVRKLLAATPTCDEVTTSSLSAYLAPGGPFETYNVVSMSASCKALATCNGITTLSNISPGS